MGEFYSEFGNFDVKITLPDNYVVGATGALQNQSEIDFLNQKVQETEARYKADDFNVNTDFPESSSSLKTLHYMAKNVHDFAWFADKRFNVLKDVATLESGKTIDTWAMFTDERSGIWQKGAFYVKRAVEFYSKHVGEYPWPHATAVHSALSAGGGMEYPMITVIGNSGSARLLDEVITHEVGHNWFYGLLASNERDYPWMDEGMNSYYEHRYMQQYYKSSDMIPLPKIIKGESKISMNELAYLFQARQNKDQAPHSHAAEFSTLNYGLDVYLKTARAFGYLEAYLGTETFDEIMKSYYAKWHFKHPHPEDFRMHVKSLCDKNLDWFFDGFLYSNEKMDYKIAAYSPETSTLKIKNVGAIESPIPVSGVKDGKVVFTKWIDGFEGSKEVQLESGSYDQIVIDEDHKTFDLYRQNNRIKTNGMFRKMEPLQFKFMGGVEDPQRSRVNWLPLVGANKYDGVMAGLALYSFPIPSRKFEYGLAPMYSFKGKELVGTAFANYHWYPQNSIFENITLGLSAKRFNQQYLDSLRIAGGYDDARLKYTRLVPSLTFDFAKAATSPLSHSIQLRSLWIQTEGTSFFEGAYTGEVTNDTWIHELSYNFKNSNVLNPMELKVALEQQSYTDAFDRDQQYLKSSLEYKVGFTFAKKKSFDVRLFAGYMFDNSKREAGGIYPGAFNLVSEGFNDYRYDELYFGRNETSGFWSKQININDGGFKTPLGSTQQSGRSNDFILALNLKSALPVAFPLRLPVKPYFDVGYFSDQRPIADGAELSDQLWWSGGFMLDFFDESLGIYFPLLYSKNGTLPNGDPNPNGLQSLYEGKGNYWSRITFTLDINALNPWKMSADNIMNMD